MSQNPSTGPGGRAGVIMDVEVAEPKMYQVLLHNDDYTTMEFVVNILMTVFHKTADQATNIMLAVHKRGKGIASLPPRNAETKVDKPTFSERGRLPPALHA